MTTTTTDDEMRLTQNIKPRASFYDTLHPPNRDFGLLLTATPVYCDATIHKLLRNSLWDFLIYVILTISYLRAQTIETTPIPTDSSRPLFEQIEIFPTIPTAYSNCKSCPNIRASYWGASSGFHLWAKSLRGQ